MFHSFHWAVASTAHILLRFNGILAFVSSQSRLVSTFCRRVFLLVAARALLKPFLFFSFLFFIFRFLGFLIWPWIFSKWGAVVVVAGGCVYSWWFFCWGFWHALVFVGLRMIQNQMMKLQLCTLLLLNKLLQFIALLRSSEEEIKITAFTKRMELLVDWVGSTIPGTEFSLLLSFFLYLNGLITEPMLLMLCTICNYCAVYFFFSLLHKWFNSWWFVEQNLSYA